MDGTGMVTGGAMAARTPAWRWALPRIAVLFLLTRAFLVAIALVVETTQPAPAPGVRWTDAPLLASLTAFDGRYYLGIAAAGYHAAPVFGPYVDYAFFPLYPALVRVASLLTLGNVDVAGVLVANAAFAVALVVLYALSVRHLARETALLGLVFLALAPGAVAFGLAYSDSLLLALAAGAFLAAETRRPALMGVALAAATLARPPGILLALPLAVLIWGDPELRARRAWAWLLLAPLVLVGFLAYTGWLTGDPLAWIHAQGIWGRPETTVILGLPGATPPPSGTPGYVTVSGSDPLVAAIERLLWLATLLFYLFLFVFFRRDRMPPAYWIVAALPILSVFAAGRLMSVPRFLAVAWPFDWTLALRRTRAAQVLALVVFAALQAVLAWLAFTWQAAP